MRDQTDPLTWRDALEFFFKEYLPRHAGFSPRTQESYATALRLFLQKIESQDLAPHQIAVHHVLTYLDALETNRHNSVSSRNVRLAALKCFFKAMLLVDPTRQALYSHLLKIPFKRGHKRSPDYLEGEELRRLFHVVDPHTHQGFRDLTLLRYLYNTGSRISEVAEARLIWLSLDGDTEVTIRGKGGKWRVCPLWKTTAEMIRVYIRQERIPPKKGYEEFLFITRRGTRFTRAGLWKLIHGYLVRAAESTPSLRRKRLTPHSLRHTTAVHLLRAGVEINVIKAWLGHADVSTTSKYLDLDLDKKREALERFQKLDIDRLLAGSTTTQTPLPKNVVAWLERL